MNYVQLVNQARQGDQNSMDQLAVVAQNRLSNYIYRLTLDQDLAQDILQETLLEMVSSLGRLRDVNKFWPWIFRTALGKVQHHYRDVKRQQEAHLSLLEQKNILKKTADEYGEGLNGLIRQELAEAIYAGMKKLKLRYRTIIALRCFEKLSYEQISETMKLKSELQARVLFFRAKKSLKKNLAYQGYNKKILITALGLFGLITTQSKVASAATAVNAASLETGASAAFVGSVFSKTGASVSALAGMAAVHITLEDVVMYTGFMLFFVFLLAVFYLPALARK